MNVCVKLSHFLSSHNNILNELQQHRIWKGMRHKDTSFICAVYACTVSWCNLTSAWICMCNYVSVCASNNVFVIVCWRSCQCSNGFVCAHIFTHTNSYSIHIGCVCVCGKLQRAGLRWCLRTRCCMENLNSDFAEVRVRVHVFTAASVEGRKRALCA